MPKISTEEISNKDQSVELALLAKQGVTSGSGLYWPKVRRSSS